MSVILTGLAANAQFSSGVKLPQATTDSVKTGALTVTKYLSVNAGYSSIGIQPVVTKNSGTVAGKVKLYGTIDGTNYISTGDSITLSNVTTNTAIWNVTVKPYAKYKIEAVGSGTMNALLNVWYIMRKTRTE